MAGPLSRVASAESTSRAAARDNPQPGPELCIVIPTYNESANVAALVERLREVLAGVAWEAVFVDDDSPDGTAERVRELGRLDDRIRCLRRVGRRGLSSACIEGMLSTAAEYIAVIDADLQHDETLLPEMLRRLKAGDVDLAIASRYVGSGSADAFSARRARLSRSGARLAQLLIRTPVADPVSGFFMLRRAVLDEAVPRLSGVGMKILIDIMASAPGPLSVVELPYRFRPRRRGESKLDVLTAVEYLLLLAEKLTPRAISHKLLLFLCVGATGIVVHVSVLRLMLAVVASSFTEAQGIATATAMVWNFFINNLLTYRDVRLTGWRAVTGLFSFMAVCSLGMIVNLAVARDLYAWTGMWLAAGVGGAAVGALLNYALASIFTWGRRI